MVVMVVPVEEESVELKEVEDEDKLKYCRPEETRILLNPTTSFCRGPGLLNWSSTGYHVKRLMT